MQRLATFILFPFLLTLSALSASAAEVNVSVDASATPSVIALNETTRVTINITSEGSPEVIFPVDAVLVMDCSGSMNRYGTIIAGPKEVRLGEYFSRVGNFTLNETADVELMLQIPSDIYYWNDRFCAYLRNEDTGENTDEKCGYSVVRWHLDPGSYEIYAYTYGEEDRILAVELPPVRMDAAKNAAKNFVDILKGNDRVALVKFHSYGWYYSGYCRVVQGLTTDKNEIKSEIDALYASGGTPMGEGLDRALDELESNGRADAERVIILLTDGWWNMGCNPIDEAERAKNDGIPIYTIGWGGVNESALR